MKEGWDCIGEIDSECLVVLGLVFINDFVVCLSVDVYIVMVLMLVDVDNWLDFLIVMVVICMVVEMIDCLCKFIIVFESIVYFGVIEDMCGFEIEWVLGLMMGIDFFLVYLFEWINFGDCEYMIDCIIKVVLG